MQPSKPNAARQSNITSRDVLARPICSQISGNLALDFCNTAGEHLAASPDEMLLEWETFIRWATQAGMIGADSYGLLLQNPAPMSKILQLREAIYRVGLAVARSAAIPQEDLLNIHKQAEEPKPVVAVTPRGISWRPDPKGATSQLCAVLATEALSLFCSPRASRIGVCAGGLCGWLFIDESRGKRRRWCDMNDCGNKAKARRYYEQHKGE